MQNISENKPLLEIRGMSKQFPGVKALQNVSLTVKAGTVHALMGENGAGKSTLMKCLFGIYHPDEGEILLNGTPVHFKNPKDALLSGVAMVHQELSQALNRSISDNLWLGRYPGKWGFVKEKEMHEATRAVFAELGMEVDPRRKIGTLSVARRQMVEIAKAISYHAKIIVLDEPTSSLADEEVTQLFRILDMLKARGCGIIYISHKMEEILQISDEITVMRDGANVATAPALKLDMDAIIRLMVGRDLTNRYPARHEGTGEVILRVEHLSSRYANLRDVSFSLRRGEILGVAGLAGAGRSELLENLFGISERAEGRLFLGDREIRNRTPREAIANGFAFLTEERRATGIFGILDICENTTLSALSAYCSGGFFVKDGARRRVTAEMIRRLAVKTASQRTRIGTLSGGNQQKVIFARWMLTEPEILLLDEPTRGIDVGAKYEIYQLLQELAAKGKAILMVSSELPELLGVCRRILVMSGGELAGEVEGERATQENIMALAAKNV